MRLANRWRFLVWVVGLVLLLDQASKLHIHATFRLHESRPVIPGVFHFTYVQNPGAAFGFLARQGPTFRQYFFPVVTGIALLALGFYFSRLPLEHPLPLWGVSLIMGGASGNGIDRLWLGQVIDFLDVFWKSYHWPAFNVADSAICIGVGLLLLDAFLPTSTTREG